MTKSKPNQRGFTAVEVVIVIVVLIVIGGVGWLVYDHNHKKTTPESSSTSSSQQTASTSKLKTATKPAKTADPYAGWKSDTLTYEKLTFKYPSAWTLKDTSANKSDQVTLAGSNGFTFKMSTGGLGHPSSEIAPKIIKAEPVTFAGQSAFLDYAGGTTTGTYNDGLIYTVYLSKSNKDAFDTLQSHTPGENASAHGNLTLVLTYNYRGKTLASLQSDSNISDSKLVIASMKY